MIVLTEQLATTIAESISDVFPSDDQRSLFVKILTSDDLVYRLDESTEHLPFLARLIVLNISHYNTLGEFVESLEQAAKQLTIVVTTVAYADSEKTFSIKDKSGRGEFAGNVSHLTLLQTTEDEQDWNGEFLHVWADECEVGDTWEDAATEITRLS